MLEALRLVETLKQGCRGELRLSAGGGWEARGDVGLFRGVGLRVAVCGTSVSVRVGLKQER